MRYTVEYSTTDMWWDVIDNQLNETVCRCEKQEQAVHIAMMYNIEVVYDAMQSGERCND